MWARINEDGHGGDVLLSQITGLNVETIRRGDKNWRMTWKIVPPTASAGRRRAPTRRKKDPTIEKDLTKLVEGQTSVIP